MDILSRLRAGISTASAGETRTLAAEFAAVLPADVTLALHGDLGAGKTTFVQGLAQGFGIAERVTSPTFNVCRFYRGRGKGSRNLAHLDAYRLDDAAQVDALLLEEFVVSPFCLAVEWPERIPGWLPAGARHLEFGIAPDGDHTVRLR
jgi:tRNA threonylcarbamoyladenosine biosynthesis protein TsaE